MNQTSPFALIKKIVPTSKSRWRRIMVDHAIQHQEFSVEDEAQDGKYKTFNNIQAKDMNFDYKNDHPLFCGVLR